MRTAILIGAAIALLGTSPASAQMAAALGKPLPVADLEVGTVTVRVIAGSLDKPLSGIDVKLAAADGKERVARTDSQGRATFTKLQPGGKYTAKAEEPSDDESTPPKQATSEAFTIPASGGVRLMISTRPWQGGGAAAPPPRMAAGMMDPRKMSGIPRGDPAVPAGSMTVAAVRGAVTIRIPKQPVHLVGYSANGDVVRISRDTAEDGRATFDGLVPRRFAYYAMSTFMRAEGESPVLDRTRSEPITLPPRVGIRIMLAGLPEDSTDPALEDLERIAVQSDIVGDGEVIARISYTASAKVPQTVSLYEIGEGENKLQKIASSPFFPPTPAEVTGSFGDVIQQPDLAVGTLQVSLSFDNRPLPGAAVQLMPVAAAGDAKKPQDSAEAPKPLLENVSNGQGMVEFTGLVPGTQYRVVSSLFNTRLESGPVAVPTVGGLRLPVTVRGKILSSAEARFTGVAPGKLYLVQAEFQGRPQRSPPFQTVAGRGAVVGLILHDKPLLSLHMNGWVDEERMGFSGQFGLYNTSAMPWEPGRKGLVIPLPKGFSSARLDGDEMKTIVKIDSDRGFIWTGPLPPGSARFIGGFSMPVEDKRMAFHMDLPLGLLNSSVVLFKSQGMRVEDLPPGARTSERKARNGRDIFVVNGINIPAGRSIAFSVTGLPQKPAVERYISYVVGALVVALLLWAIIVVITHRRPEEVGVETRRTGKAWEQDKVRVRKLGRRREQLLDDMVALEASHKAGEIVGEAYQRARSKLKKKLETVYEEFDRASGKRDPKRAV